MEIFRDDRPQKAKKVSQLGGPSESTKSSFHEVATNTRIQCTVPLQGHTGTSVVIYDFSTSQGKFLVNMDFSNKK